MVFVLVGNQLWLKIRTSSVAACVFLCKHKVRGPHVTQKKLLSFCNFFKTLSLVSCLYPVCKVNEAVNFLDAGFQQI